MSLVDPSWTTPDDIDWTQAPEDTTCVMLHGREWSAAWWKQLPSGRWQFNYGNGTGWRGNHDGPFLDDGQARGLVVFAPSHSTSENAWVEA